MTLTNKVKPWAMNGEKIVACVAFLLGAFHLINVSGLIALSTAEIRIVHLTTMLTLLFLTRPFIARIKGSLVDKLSGFVLISTTLAAGIYMLSRWQDIAMSGGETEILDGWVGIAILVVVFEGARRGVGLVLALICLVFFTYPFYSPYLPGVLEGRGYGLIRITEFLTTTSQGVYGIPLGVSSTYIIMFAIYGAFLSEFGAGEFFFRIANRLTTNMVAAGAKTAVIFSTLLGMISGSAAGNVAVTGTLTIPMMQKEDYKAHQAAAIEAVVSTGGQLMPPVMGAAAFIMAEIVGTPYANIMQAALLPAILFFTTLLFVVHLQAKKSGFKPSRALEDDDEPTWKLLLDGLRFIIPFGTLIAMMLNGYSPLKASFISILVLVAAQIIWSRRIDKTFFIKVARSISSGTRSVVPIAVACAAAGIIAGVLSITGLGAKISGLIIMASAGSILIALLLTMVVAIILGMGLPTTAAYLILATVVAPALAEAGVPLLTAHLFVFFYGCLSTITPPVALASYVAAGIAKADINKVGWTAFFYGITSYVLPFMFVFGPALMLNGTWPEIGLASVTGALGALSVAAFVVGYLRGNLTRWQRALAALAGGLMLHQGLLTDLIGLALLITVIFIKTRSASEPTEVPATSKV